MLRKIVFASLDKVICVDKYVFEMTRNENFCKKKVYSKIGRAQARLFQPDRVRHQRAHPAVVRN